MSWVLERRMRVGKSLEDTFAFFAEPRNLARITPPWLSFVMTGSDDGGPDAPIRMRQGLRIHYRIRPFGVPQQWTSEITVWEPPHRFVDEQRRGPYARWRHLHAFQAVDGGTEIHDRVEYALPLGPLGRIVHALAVGRQLESIFAFRESVIREVFA
jgi:ligand-binding SRPBCC domain-containing protein